MSCTTTSHRQAQTKGAAASLTNSLPQSLSFRGVHDWSFPPRKAQILFLSTRCLKIVRRETHSLPPPLLAEGGQGKRLPLPLCLSPASCGSWSGLGGHLLHRAPASQRPPFFRLSGGVHCLWPWRLFCPFLPSLGHDALPAAPACGSGAASPPPSASAKSASARKRSPSGPPWPSGGGGNHHRRRRRRRRRMPSAAAHRGASACLLSAAARGQARCCCSSSSSAREGRRRRRRPASVSGEEERKPRLSLAPPRPGTWRQRLFRLTLPPPPPPPSSGLPESVRRSQRRDGQGFQPIDATSAPRRRRRDQKGWAAANRD